MTRTVGLGVAGWWDGDPTSYGGFCRATAEEELNQAHLRDL